jgi:hypothetical protein
VYLLGFSIGNTYIEEMMDLFKEKGILIKAWGWEKNVAKEGRRGERGKLA